MHPLVTTTTALSPEDAATSTSLLLVAFVIATLIYIASSWSLGKVFEKIRIDGWKAWIPLYKSYILLELGGKSGWWVLASFIPFVGNVVVAVVTVMAVHEVNIKFRKETSFTVLYTFVPLAWSLILGLDDSRWRGGRVAL